jgi:murein DD-endopeptidase MepM/ murein hydrolase activator NlpD
MFLFIISLVGCVKPRPYKYPPIMEGWRKQTAAKNAYIVQTKDTLYSIAWAFNIDYRYLAAINNIQPPYKIYAGKHLYLAASRNKKFKDISLIPSITKPLSGFKWPTKGKVVTAFGSKGGISRGINIAGREGQPVFACNSGVVVYSGSGLRSYGNLMIIKHNDDYLSAYAYNQKLLVAEGQRVKVGQKIATMGRDNDDRAILHFEIRFLGKPVDPLPYLPKKI